MYMLKPEEFLNFEDLVTLTFN